MDKVARGCACGRGYIRECPDPASVIPVYIDCELCEGFYEFTLEEKLVRKTMKLKVGDRFQYPSIDHVNMFFTINEFALSFYEYKFEHNQKQKQKFLITIMEIKK